MLEHLRKRVEEALVRAKTVMLATTGPAGLQAGAFPCQAIDLRLYLLIPRASDHLVNLEDDPTVVVTTEAWQLRGLGRILRPGEYPAQLALARCADATWSEAIEVRPTRLQINQPEGWGFSETIDID